MSSGMSDDEKAIYVSLAMGLIELVKADEEDHKPKGARANALRNLYGNCDKVIDLYRIVEWDLDKQKLAGVTLDKIQKIVSGTWTPKVVGRDQSGRFCKV